MKNSNVISPDKIREDPNLVDDYIIALTPIVHQKVALVCYREGSNEMVGINWTFIESKEDKFAKQFYPHVMKKWNKKLNAVEGKKVKKLKKIFFSAKVRH